MCNNGVYSKVNEQYWIVTIDEFEALMELKTKEEFDKVIVQKMNKSKSIWAKVK